MTEPAPRRLLSLDALRGFDMLWIVGGATVLGRWAAATDSPLLDALAAQCHHVEWNGFRFWDLIFPLFLFIAGAAMPFSLTARLERGHDRGALHRHVVRRGLALVALGVVYNGLFAFDFAHLRYASVLGRIGLGYLFGALIVLHARPRAQLAWLAGILLAYWAALALVPVPGFGAGDLTPGHALPNWIDQHLLPGRLHRGDRDPEGLLSTVPAVGTALLGALAGEWLRRARDRDRGGRTTLELAAGGVLCLALGGLWDTVLPINKNLWTSSFVLWAGGCSLLLLALFHQVFDVWGWRKAAFPFVLFGSNAILIYLADRFVDFEGLVTLALGAASPALLHPVLLPVAALVLEGLLLWALWRKRVFLRV